MNRGEFWHYEPKGSPRHRNMLIVSADGVNASTRRWVYGLEVVDQDPADILAVRLNEHRWIDGTTLSRLWRDWLTEPHGTANPDILDAVDAMLRGALDL